MTKPLLRSGLTLLELLVTLALVTILASFALSNLNRRLDRIAVRGAAAEITSAFALARHAAVSRGAYVTVHVDSGYRSVTVTDGMDTLLARPLGLVHGVHVSSNRDSLAYGPLGHGFGGSNQSIVVQRGTAVDTVVVSRLGRVRWR
jgi:prepilin-type N-terminal cleavage/methylation domain-containing protein